MMQKLLKIILLAIACSANSGIVAAASDTQQAENTPKQEKYDANVARQTVSKNLQAIVDLLDNAMRSNGVEVPCIENKLKAAKEIKAQLEALLANPETETGIKVRVAVKGISKSSTLVAEARMCFGMTDEADTQHLLFGSKNAIRVLSRVSHGSGAQ